jgi:exopolysaccharide production protein ExoQ
VPPILATSITLGFIAWLFFRDSRQKHNITGAVWLPFLWVFISGSRFLSQWLGMFGFNLGGTSVDDGSPFDALSLGLLIAGGVYVLRQRQVRLAEFFHHNRWVTIYLIYCLVAIAWSDIPLVAFKRWIKLFGQPVMALIILTEPDPLETFTCLMKWLAYTWMPLSILLIRYYPRWGRAFDIWVGNPMNIGVTVHKNSLGCDAFILGLFFVWHFFRVRRWDYGIARRREMLLCLGFLILICWVLQLAHSSTSIGAFLLGSLLLAVVNLGLVNLERAGIYVVVIAVLAIAGETIFGLSSMLISALGRDPTLTGRTQVWEMLLNWDINPIFGVGFESFWQQSRIHEIAMANPGLVINESHNGYVETYINLGLLGIFLVLMMLFATFRKVCLSLTQSFDFGSFRFAYLFCFIIYNWTEAAFRTHAVPFYIFFLIALDYPVWHHLESKEPSSNPQEASESDGLADQAQSHPANGLFV